MGLALLIGLFAWLSVVMIVLALCRAAARGDLAASARPRRHAATTHASPRSGSRAATTRVAARADSVGHGLLRRA